jgi:hypothetical protein
MKTLEDLIQGSSNPKYYDHQLRGLDAGRQERLLELALGLERAGASNALDWAYSEVQENIAQTARFLVLRALCASARDVDQALDSCDVDDARGLYDALVDAGAERASLDRLVLAIARGTVWQCLTALDEGGFGQDNPVGWALAETDGEGKLTGRLVAGLHESAQEDQFLGEF